MGRRPLAASGLKTFVTSGIQADLVIVAARIDPTGAGPLAARRRARAREGFTRGRKLEKVGRKGQDTAELFFDDVAGPAART